MLEKCDKCGKSMDSLDFKACNIKGNLLCGGCFNELDDEEREAMYSIRSKEDYRVKMVELKKELKGMKAKKISCTVSEEKSNKLEKNNYFSKGFRFALGIVIFFILFFFVFRPQLVIGPIDAEGNVIVPKGAVNNVVYSTIPLKEVENQIPPREQNNIITKTQKREPELIQKKEEINCLKNKDYFSLNIASFGVTLLGVWDTNVNKAFLNIIFNIVNDGCVDVSADDYSIKYYVLDKNKIVFQDTYVFLFDLKSGVVFVPNIAPMKDFLEPVYFENLKEYKVEVELYYKGKVIQSVISKNMIWYDRLSNHLDIDYKKCGNNICDAEEMFETCKIDC